MSELIKYTKQDFIKRYTSEALKTELSQVKTVSDAMKSDVNSIAFYRKNIGVQSILASIEAQLFLLKKSINVHQNLNEYQIEELAHEINLKYYFLNMTEIAFIFKRAKTGYYGSFQYSLDMPIVLSWFEKYVEQRVTQSMKDQQNEHNRIKSGTEIKDGQLFKTENKMFSDLQIEMLLKFKNKLDEKSNFDQDEYERIKREYNENN